MLPVQAHFLEQAAACADLGSPLTARVLRLIAPRITPDAAHGNLMMQRLLAWPSGRGLKEDAVALRLAGGLHALVRQGRDAPLAALYARPEDSTDPQAEATLLAAIARHSDMLLAWLAQPPQTNEVRRSVALIAAAHWLCARIPLPLVISELGASAGLNLIWDHYRLDVGAGYGPPASPVVLRPDWRGHLPPAQAPQVAARAGVDLYPLHPVADREKLLSYIWPDQTDRLARTAAAAAMAATLAPRVEHGDAVDWLAVRLATRHPGHLHLVCHTIAWQYFPPDARARGAALLAEAGAHATLDAPLARLAMEADGEGDGAGLRLQIWPGGEAHLLARVDFHGRWIDWRAA